MKITRHYTDSVYCNRKQRNEFLACELSGYIGNSVLNVGGSGKKYIKDFLPDSTVYYDELDVAGNPDILCNLEKDLPIPVDNDSYETVICTDVLEHLDNLHEVFAELVRISSKWIVLSLPNPMSRVFDWLNTARSYKKGEAQNLKLGKHSKFYGLPCNKPVDRHKWFFSYSEAEDWVIYQEEKHNLKIVEHFPIGFAGEGGKENLKRFLVRSIYGKRIEADLFYSSLWNVFKINNAFEDTFGIKGKGH